MRPEKLIFQAFGPYLQKQVLNFQELKGRNLLLLHGPNASGKTILLDAVLFALFGLSDTRGVRKGTRELKCLHADLNLPSEVMLDFSAGGERYRVTRWPEQERPKKSGPGTTWSLADAVLRRRSGVNSEQEEGELITRGWSRVNRAVEKILGAGKYACRDMIMFPDPAGGSLFLQGAGERKETIGSLFQTGRLAFLEQFFSRYAPTGRENSSVSRQAEKSLLEDCARALSGQNRLGLNLEAYVQRKIWQDILREGNACLEGLQFSSFRFRVPQLDRGTGPEEEFFELMLVEQDAGVPLKADALSFGMLSLRMVALQVGLASALNAYPGAARAESIFFDALLDTLDQKTRDRFVSNQAVLQKSGLLLVFSSVDSGLAEHFEAELAVSADERTSRVNLR